MRVCEHARVARRQDDLGARVPVRELVDEGRGGKIRRRVVASQGGVERRAVAAARAQPEPEVVIPNTLLHVVRNKAQYFERLAERARARAATARTDHLEFHPLGLRAAPALSRAQSSCPGDQL